MNALEALERNDWKVFEERFEVPVTVLVRARESLLLQDIVISV